MEEEKRKIVEALEKLTAEEEIDKINLDISFIDGSSESHAFGTKTIIKRVVTREAKDGAIQGSNREEHNQETELEENPGDEPEQVLPELPQGKPKPDGDSLQSPTKM